MTRRRTIRASLLAVLCLLLGAVTTVGVAWYCQQRPSQSPIRRFTRDEEAAAHGWPTWAPLAWRPPQWVALSRGPGWSVEQVYELPPVNRPGNCTITRSCGWPAVALWMGEVWPDDYLVDPVPGWTITLGRKGAQRVTDKSPPAWTQDIAGLQFGTIASGYPRWFLTIATAPVPSGFAADTALYAAAWYLLICAPLPLYRTARRRIRVSRGMCPACGYDLKGSPGGVCPECGSAAPP